MKERIAFAPMNLRFSLDVQTAPFLHSSDDGLVFTTSTLRRPEEECGNLAICAQQTRAKRIARHGTLHPFVRAVCYSGAFGGPGQFDGAIVVDWPDYLRAEAAKYRQLAEQTDDPVIKNEMPELASVCEEVANDIEDRLTGG